MMRLQRRAIPEAIAPRPEMMSNQAIKSRKAMNFIEADEEGLILPYKTAIALYHGGFIDSAVLAYGLPIAIAKQLCPEVYLDTEKIQQVAEILQNLGVS